jgi:putative cell wall-binding protein
MSSSTLTPARIRRPLLLLLALALVAVLTVGTAPAAHAAWTTKRTWIGGKDLYATSALMSQKQQPTTTVYLTSGEQGGDALAAPPAAAARDARILMVRSTMVPWQVEAELRRLNPRTVVLVGSRSVLTDALWADVRSILPRASMSRVGGDRVESALGLMQHVRSANGRVSDVFVIGRNGYSDGIATGNVAARMGAALVPAIGDANAWASRVARELSSVGATRVHFIGSASVLPDTYFRALDARFTGSIDRIAGRDRYDTNARVVARFVPSISPGHAYLIAGNGHGDSIGASVLAAEQGTVMMLSGRYCHAHDGVPAQIRRLGAHHIVGIGTKHWIQTGALDLNVCAPAPSPAPAPAPAPSPSAGGGGSVYYANCAAVRAAGKAPLLRGQPGYRSGLDRDGDGVACEL